MTGDGRSGDAVKEQTEAHELAEAIRTLLHALTIRSQDTNGDGRIAFSGTELATLGYLRDQPGAMGRDVAVFLGLTPQTVQSLIDRLVRRGFIARAKHHEDGRAVALSLTQTGEKNVDAIRAQDVKNCDAMLAVLPRKRRAAFVADLTSIAQRMGDRGD